MKPINRLFGLCAGVTLLNALTSAGFSPVALSSSDEAHVNAMYTVSRSLSLVAANLLVVGFRSRTGLMATILAMALLQAGDAVIGLVINEPLKTYGPAFVSVVTVVVLLLLARSAPPVR